MIKDKLINQIKEKFGQYLYQKAKDFPKNKINIIYYRESPIKIRSLILDNDREFHLIIDDERREIFHDCPSFLIYSEIEKKMCVHLIKLFLMINENIAMKILENIHEYDLTHEDYGSHKKSKNFLLLANNCLMDNNYIEGLSFLNKAIIDQKKCNSIINRYLTISIDNDLFLEFFNFIKLSYENELGSYLKVYENIIKKGFTRFLSSISKYTFYDILHILNSLDNIFKFDYLRFIIMEIDEFKKMLLSSNFNEKYFSYYLIFKYQDELIQMHPEITDIISSMNLKEFKEVILEYFFSQIESFSIIDTLKLMKSQFETFNIPKTSYQQEYSKYKRELKELEKKLYLKKFAFLKLLMDKHDIIKTKGNFRKKRNTYIISQDPTNLKNPVYHYILSRIGFFGIKDPTIKSSEIGMNIYIFKELFLDDFNSFSDVMYYKNQFWGEKNNYEISVIDGFSLVSKHITYNYDIYHKYPSEKDVIIIEWDLANKPIQSSILQAYGNQVIIPDVNNPLFYDIKPFDLCYCKKKPVKIEANTIKSVNVISKCSFTDAIKSIQKGMSFIEGYYPLSLVKSVMQKEISPFDAHERIINNPNKKFIPNYSEFIKAFKNFSIEFINREKDFIFNELKNNMEERTNQLLILMDLKRELEGLKIDFSDIFKKIPIEKFDLNSFKLAFLKEIQEYIEELLRIKKIGATDVFDLTQLRNTPFAKYFDQILSIRKQEFESSIINKEYSKYDLANVKDTYYGKKIMELLHIDEVNIIDEKTFGKFLAIADKLNLKPHLKENDNN